MIKIRSAVRALSFTSLIVATVLLSGATPAGNKPPTVSDDLQKHPTATHRHRVIVQADDAALALLRQQLAGGLKRNLKHAVALEVSDAQLADLERNPLLTSISGDLKVTGHVAVTNQETGATSVWNGAALGPGLPVLPGFTGAGVGIAVLDSGIAKHDALDSRVVVHVDMVASEPGKAGDPFGHGTHVAGIAAGNRTSASGITPEFDGGTAPAASLVDVRVLGSTGSGLTSDVIAGLDWVVDNRQAYNIRVINLSLGHPVTESVLTDPLCQAVERAVAAGITVVASAGNDGQTSTGDPVLGGITSPGNSPAVITVGAIDTKGTLDTSDDVVAPYSSKGPTAYDFIVKPDLVAPGTRIVSLEAKQSYISTTYPQWHIAGTNRNAYMKLSGTSMSAAVVSGGVALLLNANPTLTPAQVKLVLQMGARFMPGDGLVGAGAGSVDFAQSLRIAETPLLRTTAILSAGRWGIAFNDTGTLIDRLYGRTGIQPLRLLDVPGMLQNADNADAGMLRLAGTSPFASAAPNYVVWGNTAGWSSSYYVVWGNTLQSPTGQYVVWGNADYADSTYVVWGNSFGGGH